MAGGVLIKHKRKSIVCFLVAMALVFLLPAPLVLWMPIWLLGVAAFYYAESPLPRPSVIPSALLFISAVMLSRINTHHVSNALGEESMVLSFLYDCFIGITYALLMVSVYRSEVRLPLGNWHKKLASFSYSMYVVHFPMLVFVAAVVHDVLHIDLREQPTLKHLGCYAVVILVLAFYGYLCALMTEKHTYKIKAYIGAILSRWHGEVP